MYCPKIVRTEMLIYITCVVKNCMYLLFLWNVHFHFTPQKYYNIISTYW